MSAPLDLSAAARALFGGGGSQPTPEPGTSQPAEPTDFRDAAAKVYGTSEPPAAPPATRDLTAASLFGGKAEWDAVIAEQYGDDLPQAQQLAGLGLAATSSNPAAERAAIGQSGCSPRRFAELVAAGRRVAGAQG